MGRKMFRKLLAILIVGILVVLMLPGLALAEDEGEEQDVTGTELVDNGNSDDPDAEPGDDVDEGEDEGLVEEEDEEPVEEEDEEPVEEDAPSEWAVPEIEAAIENGLTTEKVLSNYQEDITREDFCELAVKLYEALSGEEAELPEENVFTDTENEEILKANALGIVFGVSDTEFDPDANITREAIAVMFYRTLKAVHPALVAESFDVTFADADDISDWAVKEIGFMNNKGIIKGVDEDNVAPKGNATREQAIALVNRTYEAFKGIPLDELEMPAEEPEEEPEEEAENGEENGENGEENGEENGDNGAENGDNGAENGDNGEENGDNDNE